MKKIILSILVIAAIIGCSSSRKDTNNIKRQKTAIANDTIRIANDSLEYEITIIEPGFQFWLSSQPPRGYYAQSAMEITNNMRVIEYNLRVQNPLRYDPTLYPWRIAYDNKIDYGYEVNYMLHNYFLFFEQKYNQRLL